MKIGVDFDNTIVCYDNVFYLAALEKKLIPQNILPNKGTIRDFLRSIGKEEEWTILQGFVYGKKMNLATPYEGVDGFFNFILKNNFQTYIISHKTLYPYKGPKYNLHEAAKKWIKTQGFSDIECYFETTLLEKLDCIGKLNCEYFIDDLPELLLEKKFPKDVKKILFDPNNLYEESENYKKFSSWIEICRFLNCL
jgi:hypothetical protein